LTCPMSYRSGFRDGPPPFVGTLTFLTCYWRRGGFRELIFGASVLSFSGSLLSPLPSIFQNNKINNECRSAGYLMLYWLRGTIPPYPRCPSSLECPRQVRGAEVPGHGTCRQLSLNEQTQNPPSSQHAFVGVGRVMHTESCVHACKWNDQRECEQSWRSRANYVYYCIRRLPDSPSSPFPAVANADPTIYSNG
jgi:hypothetical protein